MSGITTYPAGAAIPATFLAQVRAGQVDGRSTCLKGYEPDCEAYVLDVDGSGATQVLLNALPQRRDSYLMLEVFKQGAGGVWAKSGELTVVCADSIAALRAGHVTLAASPRRDIRLAGRPFALAPLYGCPETGNKSPLGPY